MKCKSDRFVERFIREGDVTRNISFGLISPIFREPSNVALE